VAALYRAAGLSYKWVGWARHLVPPASGKRAMAEISPVIGNWYRHENGELFEVVALDADDATVEIQYFDGTIEELDFDAWEQMEIEEAEPPEDWSGPLDVDDDEIDEFQDKPAEDFDDPLEYLDRQD
jgi:hypothetical protein